jgi:hypothetical protein
VGGVHDRAVCGIGLGAGIQAFLGLISAFDALCWNLLYGMEIVMMDGPSGGSALTASGSCLAFGPTRVVIQALGLCAGPAGQLDMCGGLGGLFVFEIGGLSLDGAGLFVSDLSAVGNSGCIVGCGAGIAVRDVTDCGAGITGLGEGLGSGASLVSGIGMSGSGARITGLGTGSA